VSRILLLMGVVGAALLLAATVTLVKLNWSEKVMAPLFSIILGGTVTTLIATLSMLRPSLIELKFLTSVVLDTATNRPIWVTTYPIDTPLTRRMSELIGLGNPVRNRNGVTEATVEPPKSLDEEFSFCGELVQYQFIRTIRDIQHESIAISQSDGTSTSTLHYPPSIPRLTKYPGNQFTPIIASNRFANSDPESFSWDNANFPLPTGTKVELAHIQSSPSYGPEDFIIRLVKPSFFRVAISIRPEFSPGAVSRNLPLSEELKARAKTFNYKVTLRADFERLTAGNWQTESLKKWIEWLFDELKARLGD
jgi:hypothetical protein